MVDDEPSGGGIEPVGGATGPEKLRTPVQDGGSHEGDMQQEKLERLFRAHTSQRRRYLLYELQGSGTSDLDTLATIVTATEQGCRRPR